ncbi:MAG TPA: hypothetical protein VIX80_01825 [Candidatus Kapabacteria bacterium]
MDSNSSYEAGSCNIDIQGVRIRKKLGTLTAVIGLLILAIMFYFRVDPMIRFMITAGFGAGAALNFIQANEHFCVANSLQGTMEEGMKRTKIGRTEIELQKDRKKMYSIIIKTAVTALAAGSFGLLPV